MSLVITLVFALLVSLATGQTNQPEIIPNCPNQCICFTITDLFGMVSSSSGIWVNCERVKLDPSALKSIPPASQFPEKTYGLDLSFNNISLINKTDEMPYLRYLKVSANAIQTLDEHAFEGLSGLESLTLSYNNISRIPLNLFKPLIQLKILDLSVNSINDIAKYAFQLNGNLEQLILSHNPIKIIFSEWFESLSGLKELKLDQTQLYSLRPEDFHRLRSLTSLDLSGNLFSSVPNQALRMLSSLQKLKINNNPIKVLNQESFQHMYSLIELEVCQNDILIEIHSRSFGDLINLRNLTVAENHDLVFMDPAAFRGIYNSTNFKLKHLSLRKNSLHSLPAYSLPFQKLEYLDLRQNPWQCDCSFLWVREIPGLVGDPRCARPDELRGIEVHQVSEQQCHPATHPAAPTTPMDRNPEIKIIKSLILLVSATLIFLLGMVIAFIMKRHDILGSGRKNKGSIYYVKAQTNPTPVGSLI